MSENTITFSQDLTTALTTMEALNLKGQRPQAVLAFLKATTDDDRLTVVESYGAGLIRRGLRQVANRFDRKGDSETADVFWALRDDIDEETDEVFVIDAA